MANKKAQYDIEYQKTHLKRIPLDVQKSWYESTFLPALQKTGEPANTFIKKAIAERLERETPSAD